MKDICLQAPPCAICCVKCHLLLYCVNVWQERLARGEALTGHRCIARNNLSHCRAALKYYEEHESLFKRKDPDARINSILDTL